MKFSHSVPEPNSFLFKSENATSEMVSAEGLQRKAVQATLLSQFWQYVLNLLIEPAEPRIRRKRDRYGNSYFDVFDPVTKTSSVFGSEQEVRVWVEQRYYSSHQ